MMRTTLSPAPSARARAVAIRCVAALGLLLAIGAGLGAQTTPAMPPDAERQLAREIYKEMVEINSGYTTGSTTPVAEAVARRLKAAGFPDADVFVGGPIPTKANLVVRYRGSGKRRPLLLLAHTDVVEAKREDWTMDPFTLTERDGYFYGRGTGDDKAQAAVWIANLIRYKREGFTPDRDLIVALTADEEGGGPYNGVAWLLKNKRELIDAEYCLNEGGWGESVGGRRLANDLQVSEKYVINYRLEVTNKGGHSSMPVPDNAIYHLAGALDRLSTFAFPLKTNEVTRAYFKAMAKIEDASVRDDLAQTAEGNADAMARVARATTAWNATLRTTCVATQLEGGHARNALPQLAAANVNCRVLPDEKPEDVTATLKRVIADEQVSVTIMGDVSIGPPSPMRQDVLTAVSTLTTALWPGVPTVPMMVMGATDGLYLRGAGIPTYGVQGFFYDRDDIRFHGRDERLKVQSFYEGQTFLYELVKRLSADQPGAVAQTSTAPTASPAASPAAAPAKPAIIAYVFARNALIVPSEIAVDKLTHINYAFADVKDGRVVEGFSRDGENFALLATLRREHPHLKILISVGGWTWSNNFSDAALTVESRRRFTDSAIAFVRRHDIDGVDIDWEYPGLRGNNNVNRPEDKENFTALMTDLRQALDAEGRARNRRYLLTFAAGAFPDFIAKTEMDKVQAVVDYVNLMTYDFRTSDPIAGHHANLYLNPADTKQRSADSAVRDFIAAGVPPAKVVVGVPFYGRAWADIKGEGTGLYQPGSRPTERIETNYGPLSTTLVNRGGFVRMWDSQAQAPYLWNPDTRTFISYEDPESLRLKSAYIREKGLGGVMFWEYYGDKTGVLLDTLFTALHGPAPATPRTPSPQ